MNTWIYQVNPAKFDVNGCLIEAPERLAWSVSRYEKDMKPGDRVFVWRSKSDGTHGVPGIIAECAVDSLVSIMPADSHTTRFARKSSTTGDSIKRVWLRIIAIATDNGVLTADEIARHGSLSSVGPLGFNGATNYKVSGSESHTLNSLWNGRTKR
jgi:hypothetical protein